jgi:coenzyme F420-reducing hydrogenase beta subunit/O-antigen/teichoic acid export membrane protein
LIDKRKIAINTVATYSRSVLTMGLALFSSRWVLGSLGKVDFGLFNVVGSIIVFITFLNGVMNSSAARHFAYAIGEGNKEEVKKWFNASLSIHIVLPLILTAIGYGIGLYAIDHFLNIPVDRLRACRLVFGMSLVAALFNMISVPFTAMYTAKQRISELAVFMGLNSLLTFSFAFVLTKAKGDLLIFYGTYMMGINVAIPVLQAARAYVLFPECKLNFSYWFNPQKITEIAHFAGWQLFGNFGYILRNQGVAILVNKFFGAAVNSSYGIANQVSSQTASLAGAMNGAFAPAITTAEGGKNRDHTLTLALAACKYGTLLVLLFALPLILEIDYVLTLWLKQVPQYTSQLCVLILIGFMIDKLTAGHQNAVVAYGKIARYQMVNGTLIILTLPLTWLFFALGYSPVSLGYSFVIMRFGLTVGRLLFGLKLVNLSIVKWLVQVVLPLSLIAGSSLLTGSAIQSQMAPSFLRLVAVCAATFCLSTILAWLLVLRKDERGFIKTKIKKLWSANKHAQICDPDKCTGCAACYNRCPQQCISMETDSEGFKVPVIDEAKCVGCNLCRQVCPVLNKAEIENAPEAYACSSKNNKQLLTSSSGGVFPLLARQVVEQHGVVLGAAFDEEFNVYHTDVESGDQLSIFQGSKYVQSEIGNTFTRAKSFLEAGRKVLFSGTPCQIAGLKSFLGQTYENLCCVDFICHGIPSPKVWRKYLAYQEELHDSTVQQVCFRDKTEGWDAFSLKIDFVNGEVHRQKSCDDFYMRVFLNDLCLRKSCYQCRFRTLHRQSDVTLADFWGIRQAMPEMYNRDGVSLLIANSPNGKQLVEKIKSDLNFRKFPFEQIPNYNKAMVVSPKCNPRRSRFFRQLDHVEFEKLIYFTHEAWVAKLKRTLKSTMRQFLQTAGLLEIAKKIKRKKTLTYEKV